MADVDTETASRINRLEGARCRVLHVHRRVERCHVGGWRVVAGVRGGDACGGPTPDKGKHEGELQNARGARYAGRDGEVTPGALAPSPRWVHSPGELALTPWWVPYSVRTLALSGGQGAWTMKIKTRTKAGHVTLNHNRTKLVVRTGVKAGLTPVVVKD